MIAYLKRGVFFCLLSLCLVAEDDNALWKNSRKDIEKALALEEEKADLPDSKWLRRDKKSADEDLNKILTDVLGIFEVTRLTELRQEYTGLGDRIQKRREEIRAIREKTLSAPEDTNALEFYRKTRQDLLDEIAALEKDIDALETQQDEKVAELRAAFAEQGLTLSTDQLHFYLGTVSGEDLMSLAAVFENVRAFNGQLETLVKDSPDDPEAARRYYGMHVVLIRTLLLGHERTLDRLDNRYLANLDALEKENEALRKETRRLLRFADDEEKPLLEASLRTQQATDEAINLYRNHLKQIRQDVYEGKKALDRRYEVALNAFYTLRVSAMLVREMEAALQDLNALKSLKLPDLLPIQDEAIRDKFMDIGERLRNDPGD